MKTEPTQLDREAAGLFNCDDGMRAGVQVCIPLPGGLRWEWDRDGICPAALDTDDPATVGCMLAQLERHGAVTVVDRLHSLGEPDRRFMVIVERNVAEQETATGPTRGAALVAMARNLAEVKP